MSYMLHILVAILVGLPRVLGIKTQTYQAIAHLYVGGLISSFYLTRDPFWIQLIIGLSVLEVACFLYFRRQPAPAA